MIDRRHRNIPVDEEGRDVEDSLKVKTAFGSVKATGGQVVLVFLVAVIFGILYSQTWMHDAAGEKRSGVIIQHVDDLKSAVKDQTEAIKAQTYLSTLSQTRREAFELDVPESLKGRAGR